MENQSIHPQPESTTATRDLPLELLIEILTRLPVKPLACFKTVSKSFLSLITSRHFILRHITHSLSQSTSSTTNLNVTRLGRSTLATLHFPTPNSNPTRKASSNTIHLPFSTRAPDSDFIGSCHGLLLISDHPNFISLFNPTTRTHFTLPVRVPRHKSESHWVDFGLGYDAKSDVYKIIRVDQFNGPGTASKPREVRVFTMYSNDGPNLTRFRWRKGEGEVNFPLYLAHPKGHGKYLNNTVYWMATRNPPNVYDVGSSMRNRGTHDKTLYKYVVVAFDLSHETFREIELPFSNSWLKKHAFAKPKLVLLGHKLGVQIEYGEIDRKSVELWLMSEYSEKNSWVKLYNFLYDEARRESRSGSDVGHVTPMMMVENGGDNVEVLMEENGGKQVKYFWYDVASGGIKDVEVCGGELPSLFEWRGGHPCDYGGVVYVESLIALNNDGLVHAQPPENPAEDITDINGSGLLPFDTFRAHSQDLLVHRPDMGRCFVPVVGFGHRLP